MRQRVVDRWDDRACGATDLRNDAVDCYHSIIVAPQPDGCPKRLQRDAQHSTVSLVTRVTALRNAYDRERGAGRAKMGRSKEA